MNYKNGKVYVLRSHQTDDVYYGSTCSTLSKRLYNHKCDYKSYSVNKTKSWISSYDIVKYPDVYIELVEECPCESRIQLLKREGEYIRANPCVNKNIAGNTNGDTKEYKKQHRLQNLEHYKENIKKYYEANKEHLKECNKKNYEENKEHYKEYKRQWYITNKQRKNS
jgi:hypothetical protein